MENEKQKLRDRVNSATDRDLCNLIIEVNNLRKTETNNFLKTGKKQVL